MVGIFEIGSRIRRDLPRIRHLRALVLHRTPAREKDRMVEVFSREEGRLRLLAAGVRRFPSRRAGHLEPLFESELTVSQSSRGDSIRDARALRVFRRLRDDLERLQATYTIVRQVRENTAERLPDPRLYDAILALLRGLDAPGIADPALFLLSADIHLLQHLGLLLDLRRCTHCRSPLRAQAFVYDRASHGFLCTTCAGAQEIPQELTDAVKLLRLLRDRPVPAARMRVSLAVIEMARGVLRRPSTRKVVRMELKEV